MQMIIDMNNKYEPITDSDNPIVDFGESWGRIDKKGKHLFEISKKDNPEWLRAFLLKWMQSDEKFTEYGEQYYNDFYHKQ